MVLIVPQPAGGSSPIPQSLVGQPSFRVRFLAQTGGVAVDLSFQQMQAATQIGRTSNRTDGTAAGHATLSFDDTARNLDPDFASSPLNGLLTPGSPTTVVLDCAIPGVGYEPLYTGLIDDIGTTWDDAFRALASVQLVDPQRDLTTHVPAANVVYPFQQSGARIAQLVGAKSRSGWGWINRAPSQAYAIDAGQKMVGPLTTDGTTATWTYVADAAAAEEGLVFFNQAGVLTFHSQSHRSRQSVAKWTFGENTGELHYEPSVAMDLPNDRIITDIAYDTADGITSGYGPNGAFGWDTASNSAGATAAQPTATSTPLADQYSGASRSRSEWRRFSVNHRDIPSIQINAFVDWADVSSQSVSNRAWCALTAQIGDLVTVNRRPPGGTITKSYYIDAIAHTIGPGVWTTQFYLVATDLTVAGWNLGNDKLGAIKLAW